MTTKQSYTVGNLLLEDTAPLSPNATVQSEDSTFSGVGHTDYVPTILTGTKRNLE